MKTDARLKQDVLAEMQRDACIDPIHLGIRVGDGIVMLTGCLSGFAEMDAIERAVRRVQGVKAIAMEFDMLPETPRAASGAVTAAALGPVHTTDASANGAARAQG
jgi:BON domain